MTTLIFLKITSAVLISGTIVGIVFGMLRLFVGR